MLCFQVEKKSQTEFPRFLRVAFVPNKVMCNMCVVHVSELQRLLPANPLIMDGMNENKSTHIVLGGSRRSNVNLANLSRGLKL